MFADFRIEVFQNRVGDVFRLAVPDGPELELRLSAVTALSTASTPPEGFRPPFSILFHGPTTPWVKQATHRLEHRELGLMDLFLVPIGFDAVGMRYEAVFT
jgi:hypothetical protein